MNAEKKEAYVPPEVVKHELLRDITATKSGYNHTNLTNNTNYSNHHRGGLFGWFGRFGGW
jgi:hypothetical protein